MTKIIFAALLASSLVSAADQPKIKLPEPYATPSASNAPKIVAQPEGKQLNLPAGFHSEEFASAFKKPRYMIQSANGAVLVTDAVPDGSVIAIL